MTIKKSFYAGMIKVVCSDLMCFPVNPISLEATACSCYDPWALSDPDSIPVETISYSEWLDRKNQLWGSRQRYT